jgi:hypothetical protein
MYAGHTKHGGVLSAGRVLTTHDVICEREVEGLWYLTRHCCMRFYQEGGVLEV